MVRFAGLRRFERVAAAIAELPNTADACEARPADVLILTSRG